MSDQTLVQRAQQGDRDAFGILVERHLPAVTGFLVSVLHDLDSAQDVAQQAFVQAFAKLDRFEGRSSFKTWVSQIAFNLARSRLRWSRIRGWLSLESLGKTSPDEDQAGSWEDSLRAASSADQQDQENLERRLELEQAMKRLSPREREITAMRLEGYALGEIAEVLKITTGTVKSTLHQATEKLKNELT